MTHRDADSTVPAPPPDSAQHAAGNSRTQSIAQEQRFVDSAYSALDSEREEYTKLLTDVRSRGAQGTPGARSERDSFASHYEDTLLRLRNVEDRLVLGRLDLRFPHSPNSQESTLVSGSAGSDTTSTVHIGRITLRDSDQNILLTDWRAPQSEPFYQATAAHPGNVVRRRHIQTRFRKVMSVEDELLSRADDANDLNLTGEGALMAAISAARDGKMGDIVATIQSEQDRIIRASDKGVLVVQGGPGTGKTAVALHRAAYLLYTYRERLERSGVLVIGPSNAFLRYIDQVLPSLGESDVVFSTIDRLVPGVEPSGSDDAEVREIKGRTVWVDIARRAVTTSLERKPTQSHSFRINGVKVSLTRGDVIQAQNRARKSEKTHNEARETYARYLVRLLAQRVAAEQNTDIDSSPWIVADVASDPDVRRDVNRYWLPASASWLLAHVFSHPDLFAQVAPELSPEERARLSRPRTAPITPSDIPIIDEILDHLGPLMSEAERQEALHNRQEREEIEHYVASTMASMNLGGGIVRSDDLVRQVSDATSAETLAERARADRLWTYGHVVIDEAQELSPMAWRMVLRRNPSRSMTIVGDLDQRRFGSLDGDWRSFLGPLASNARVEELTVSYRTPSSVLTKAVEVMKKLGAPVHPIRGARDVRDAYSFVTAEFTSGEALSDALLSAVSEQLASLDAAYGEGNGIIGVIAPVPLLDTLEAPMARVAASTNRRFSRGDRGDAQLQLLSPEDTKGLEYDSVIVVDPRAIFDQAAGDLYVALTRATQSLTVIGKPDDAAEFAM